MLAGEQEVLVDASTIKENDKIVIHMGNVIPFDGITFFVPDYIMYLTYCQLEL